MDINLHTVGSAEVETISVEETAMVGILVEGREGEQVWVEDVDVVIALDVTFVAAGIGHGHHVHRGPCRSVSVEVHLIGTERHATLDVGPATTVGEVLRRSEVDLGAPGEQLEALDRASGLAVANAVHVGSLAQGGACRVALDAAPAKVKIIVNARPREVPAGDISFDQVVALAFETPPPGNDLEFTVTYRHGEPSQPKGSLLPGHSVRVREGMVFVVTATDKS